MTIHLPGLVAKIDNSIWHESYRRGLFKCQYCKVGRQNRVVALQKLRFVVFLVCFLIKKVSKFSIWTWQNWTSQIGTNWPIICYCRSIGNKIMAYESLPEPWLKLRCACAYIISRNFILGYLQMVVFSKDKKCLILLTFFFLSESVINLVQYDTKISCFCHSQINK